MKKLIFVLLLLPLFTFAQLDDEETQFFGTTRSIANGYDFGKITGPTSYEFEIQNPSVYDMQIVGFKMQEGIGVVLTRAKIPAHGKGKFTVVIDPKNFHEKGDFEKVIVVIIKQKRGDGSIITSEKPYLLKGSI